MDDSFDSATYGQLARGRKKKQPGGSRGGPEGGSMGLSSHATKPNTSTPASDTQQSKKTRNRNRSKSEFNSSSDYEENHSPQRQKKTKRKILVKTFEDGDGNSFGSVDSKRSRLSSEGASIEEPSMSRKKPANKRTEEIRQRAAPQTDLSWEMAVEKARGLPDGAMGSEADDDDAESEMDDDEIDVDAPPPEKAKVKAKSPKKGDSGKPEKTKSKPLNMIQNAAKRLKQLKSKSSEGDSPKKASKRKSEEDLNDAVDKKKTKPELTKKDRKIQRKMTKPNYELGAKAKGMWNELRRNDLPLERRQQLSGEVYALVKGKAFELVVVHDTSRVIQCMMKYGTQEHKNAIFEELREHIPAMAKSKYAKFFVRKLLKYGTKAQRNYVFRKLYGNVRKLIKHAEAAEIIECAYNDYANVMQRHALVEEFYGPSFALFKTAEQKSLEEIIQSNPEKKDHILSNMKEALTGLADKSVLQYSIIHRVFLEFFTIATDKLRSEMIETIRDGVVHMLHTRDGSRVAMMCIWHGGAKDRKVIIKSFKSYVAKISVEEYGHLALLAVFDVVDDTKLVQKIIIEEMLKSLHELALDQFGRKVILYLLSPRDPVHFHPDIVKVLEQGDNNPHSKKEASVRRGELTEMVSRPLVQYVKQHCKELVTNNAALLLILSIITHAKTDPTDAMRAVAELAAEPFVAGSLENVHIVEHTAGHITLKRLLLNDATRMKNGETVLFSGILLDVLKEGSLKSWAACNRGCFTLLNLLELNHPEITKKVAREILPIKDSLRKMDFKGAHMILNKLKS